MIKEITKILQSICYDRNYYDVVRDFFEMSAISIRNAVDYSDKRNEYEERYMRIAKTYNKEHLAKFAEALGLLVTEISKAVDGNGRFADWTGEIYMDSKTYNKDVGQFFTHYHISHLMANVALDWSEIKKRIAEDSDTVITINEPTCGAGGLIVAAIETLQAMKINYAWNVFVDCCDIDSRCVHATYLTLSLLGVPAIVRLGDTLRMEYREAWFTPAYIFAYPHFNKRIHKKDNAVKVDKNDVKIKTEVDKTGQLSFVFDC